MHHRLDGIQGCAVIFPVRFTCVPLRSTRVQFNIKNLQLKDMSLQDFRLLEQVLAA